MTRAPYIPHSQTSKAAARKLGNMPPGSAMDDIIDGCLADAKLSRKSAHCDVACRIAATNVADLFIGQFGISVRLTAFARHNMSSFVNHVSHIVGMGAKKKMRGILAKRVVAMVAHTETGRNGTAGDGPRKTMGSIGAPETPKKKCTVTARSAARCPFPTLVGTAFLYFLLEAFNVLRSRRREDTMFDSHARLLIRRSWQGRLVACSAGRPLFNLL